MNELFLSLIDALVDGFGNAVGWILIGILAFIADAYRRIRSNAARIDNLDRYITGDEDDPETPGLLSEVSETRRDIRELRNQMDNHHRQTDRKLDRLLDNDNE
jgi:hypothetical protein